MQAMQVQLQVFYHVLSYKSAAGFIRDFNYTYGVLLRFLDFSLLNFYKFRMSLKA